MNINVWLPVSHFVMQVWETQGGRGWERGREGTVLTSNCEWLCLELKDILGLAVLPIGKLTGLWGWIKQRGEGEKKALLMQAHAQLGNRSSGPERVNTDLTGYRCSTSNPTDAHPAVRPQHWSRRPHVSHTHTHTHAGEMNNIQSQWNWLDVFLPHRCSKSTHYDHMIPAFVAGARRRHEYDYKASCSGSRRMLFDGKYCMWTTVQQEPQVCVLITSQDVDVDVDRVIVHHFYVFSGLCYGFFMAFCETDFYSLQKKK